jgi:hypothetical protein
LEKTEIAMSEYATKSILGKPHVKIDSRTWAEISNGETPQEAYEQFCRLHNRPYEGMNSIQRSNAEKIEKAAEKDKCMSTLPEPPLNEDDLGLKGWADELED